MKIIKHYVTANRSDEEMEFLGYVKDEKDGPILQKSRKQKKRKRSYILLSIYCSLISLRV